MSSVRAERLSFSYTDAVPVLSHVDLHLPAGFTGVVGENGAGKSTLLRLVAGELEPTGGRVRIEPERALVIHCPQDVDAPTADALRLARAGDAGARRLRSELNLDPVQVERWRSLSPGERRRWQIAAALSRDPDVLLLDEPTNHVDEQCRAVLLAALRRFRGVGLLVSHDRDLLEALATRTLRLHRGEAALFGGAYEAARHAWEAAASAAWDARAAAQEHARELSRRLDEARRRAASAGARRRTARRAKGPRDHDARSMGAKVVAGWAQARVGREVEVLRRDAERAAAAVPGSTPDRVLGRSVFVAFERAARPVLLSLEVDAIRAGRAADDEAGDGRRLLLRDVRVRLGREDRVHLRGPNGAGKTTLLRRLVDAAALPPDRVLYLPQELEPGEGAAVLDSVRRLPEHVRGRVLAVVAALGVDPERLLLSRDPSPGEARKLVLASGLGRHAWAVILDEPTNHLDLPSIERVERALAAYPGAVLLVSHDAAFARRCTSSTWRIEEELVRCE